MWSHKLYSMLKYFCNLSIKNHIICILANHHHKSQSNKYMSLHLITGLLHILCITNCYLNTPNNLMNICRIQCFLIQNIQIRIYTNYSKVFYFNQLNTTNKNSGSFYKWNKFMNTVSTTYLNRHQSTYLSKRISLN